jgi:hypothetical protein
VGDESTVLEWRIRAMTLLRRVTAAQRRLQTSMSLNEVTMLAAADELQAASRDVMAWLTANPCPEWRLGVHVLHMLNTCTEVAHTTQRVVTDPSADIEAVMGRLGGLLAVIDLDSKALDAW